LGDAEAAVSALQRGLQVYDSAAMYRLLAAAYREQQNWKEERAALENQFRLDPSDAYVSYRLGLLLTVFAPERALPYLMLAASLDPQFDPAVQTLRSALNLSAAQPSASQQRVTLGRALGLVKEWELAGLAFEKALALDEENAEAWAWLGEAKQQLGQDGTAELDKAVSLDPASVVARGLRALYWSRQGKYALTLAEYALAAKYEPQNPAWQAGMGSAYAGNGDLVSALSAYQRAVELAPNEAAYWSLLAVFCADYGIYLEEIGLPAANKAVGLSPDDPAALDALGWVYLSSGRYASAEQTLSAAAARFPDSPPISIHLAMTYLAQGNHSAAFETLTRAKNLDPRGVYGETAARLLERYFP
jgi:tetratricopeptide (TPR) repeat protein